MKLQMTVLSSASTLVSSYLELGHAMWQIPTACWLAQVTAGELGMGRREGKVESTAAVQPV